jgi:hypothetical protein
VNAQDLHPVIHYRSLLKIVKNVKIQITVEIETRAFLVNILSSISLGRVSWILPVMGLLKVISLSTNYGEFINISISNLRPP